jgi:protein involved in polysaccharide export with SLBB domain
MYTLATVLVAVAVAGSLTWRIHRANKKVMQILREETETSDIVAPAQRSTEAMRSPSRDPEKTGVFDVPRADDGGTSRTGTSRRFHAS